MSRKIRGKGNTMDIDQVSEDGPISESGGPTPEMQTFVSKVPEVTLVFWIIKIVCTTLGEIGADALTMSYFGETTADVDPFWKTYGYLVGAAIFFGVFIISVGVQISAKHFHPFIYWTTIVATTLLGTALADYFTRSGGAGYFWGSVILFACVAASLVLWKAVTGTIDIASVRTARSEIFYWVTIMFSQTLGTALGDYVASDDGLGLGYLASAAIFGGAMLVLVLIYYFTSSSRTILFWIAFILTRPLGAVVGDFLDKPHEDGGLELSRHAATAILLVLIIAAILVFPQKPAEESH